MHRILQALAILGTVTLLSGCIAIPRSEYTGNKSSDGMDRWLALHDVRTNSPSVTQPGDIVLRTGISPWQFGVQGYRGGPPGSGKPANCPYASTPAPVATKSLILVYFVIPIPPPREGQGTRKIEVACDDAKKEKFEINADRSKAFIDAWHRLALPDTAAADRAAFDKTAAEFRTRTDRTALPESVRAHKIAAESAVREKRYPDAIREFNAGLALEPAWPQAWYNKALVYAELDVLEGAIDAMERYLQLMPDADNARQAQDRIYEWKAKLTTTAQPATAP